MWKDFFYFSKGQRIGIIVLIIFIFCAFVLNFILPSFFTNVEPDGKTFISEAENFKRSLASRDSLRQLAWKNKYEKMYENYKSGNYHNEQIKYTLFHFNPNKADSLTFIKLGLNSYTASNILKYRNKGGMFKTKESFSKVYGISPVKYKELESYIEIDEKQVVKTDSVVKIIPEIKKVEIVELNSADTTELMKVKGIGRGYAKGIMRYRKALGGFYSVEQLREIYGMTAENFEKIRNFCKINADLIQKINVNTASIDRLNAHPYLNFYQSKSIYELRRNKGRLKNVLDLKNLVELSSEDLTKVQPYLSFE